MFEKFCVLNDVLFELRKLLIYYYRLFTHLLRQIAIELFFNQAFIMLTWFIFLSDSQNFINCIIRIELIKLIKFCVLLVNFLISLFYWSMMTLLYFFLDISIGFIIHCYKSILIFQWFIKHTNTMLSVIVWLLKIIVNCCLIALIFINIVRIIVSIYIITKQIPLAIIIVFSLKIFVLRVSELLGFLNVSETLVRRRQIIARLVSVPTLKILLFFFWIFIL